MIHIEPLTQEELDLFVKKARKNMCVEAYHGKKELIFEFFSNWLSFMNRLFVTPHTGVRRGRFNELRDVLLGVVDDLPSVAFYRYPFLILEKNERTLATVALVEFLEYLGEVKIGEIKKDAEIQIDFHL